MARKQIKRVLDQLGVEATLCNDGKQGLQQLQQWVAEGKDLKQWLALVISDVEMPVMDGYALTAAIRKSPELKELHIILHTSLSGVFNEAMVQKVGADQFLAKFAPDELATVVQNRLLAYAAEQERSS